MPECKDALGNVITVGDAIVYAVRDGSCLVALRRGYVSAIDEGEDGNPVVYATTPNARLVALRYPDRIVAVTRLMR